MDQKLYSVYIYINLFNPHSSMSLVLFAQIKMAQLLNVKNLYQL